LLAIAGHEDRLVKFACVVESGSFTEAARRLHISQPALSMAIAQLERSLGTPLLQREARPLQVTPAGKRAYVAAKRISAATGSLINELAELGQHKQDRTIGMTDSLAYGLLRNDAWLRGGERDARLSLVVHNSRFLHRAVERDELDVAFAVSLDDALSETLEVQTIGAERMVLVCHPAELSATLAMLRQGQIERFISYDQPSTSRAIIVEALAARRVRCQVRFASTSPEVMLRLVLLRQGVSVLPLLQVESLLARGELTMVSPNGKPWTIERPIVQITRRNKRLPSDLESLPSLIREVLQH